MTLELTLRKCIVVKNLGRIAFYAKDIFNNSEILVSLSAHQRKSGVIVENDQIVYIIVSPLNLRRGKLFDKGIIKSLHYKGDLFADKLLLDDGIDPTLLDKCYDEPPLRG